VNRPLAIHIDEDEVAAIETAAVLDPMPARPPRSLPYGLHLIEEDDIAAVTAALRDELLAQGPRVAAFEAALAAKVGARHAVASSSGTAALHLALASLDVGPGDLCVVPAVTFLSTATAALYCGAEVVFADVDPDTGLMTAETLEEALARAGWTKAVLPVHLSGRLCDMPALSALARAHGAAVVEDACHALGSLDAAGAPAGACTHSDAAVFSFHPVKTIATGEGGMTTLNDPERDARLRRLRNHGVTREAGLMGEAGSFDAAGAPNPWAYEQLELGFNYRMNEMEAALGLSQLAKLDRFVERRRSLAARYDRLLVRFGDRVKPVASPPGQTFSPHIYTVLIDFDGLGVDRAALMSALVARGIGTQVHYIPLYRQPFFKARYGETSLAGAEAYYARCLALPLFPAMSEAHVDQVVLALAEVLGDL
jgi:UDP-4-amino-4,6-dideoxy-N-acetyl-beta-L-altrosamine transaminase